jgi:hypothetical protein
MSPAGYTLGVNGVADLYGNVAFGATFDFDVVDNDVPAGYYAGAEGLFGDELRAALHGIIDGHTVWAYDYAWTGVPNR